uniref:Chemokine interleukin-8-like domain-containing protein n=1 Tax=Coturnix japonica TaxID=93934 RepID=A0A8C2TC47_COTJA
MAMRAALLLGLLLVVLCPGNAGEAIEGAGSPLSTTWFCASLPYGLGEMKGLGPSASPLEGKGLKPCMFSRIKLKTLERICVDPSTPWVRKLLQDLPKLRKKAAPQ